MGRAVGGGDSSSGMARRGGRGGGAGGGIRGGTSRWGALEGTGRREPRRSFAASGSSEGGTRNGRMPRSNGGRTVSEAGKIWRQDGGMSALNAHARQEERRKTIMPSSCRRMPG
eukprot:759383-Hanusia_phi.AAC.2